ncbi:YycH family regulatory protein [Solibacillus silvestris]|uniref:YycH family regulatory protein n=1 Tax=Solibacillus silvestris TaxID=76853 RepID=UPI003F7CEF1F
MKYIEQIKSLLLAFLVLLSIVFTLLIWNYKPDYELIGESQIDEVLIGKPKELQDVLKPYRLLYRQNDQFSGTVSPNVLNDFYSYLRTWQTYELDLIDSNLSNQKMNGILRKNNRVTMFFNDEVPLQVFSNVLSFDDNDVLDASFTHLIVDWSNVSANNQLQLLFLNTEKRLLFRAYADLLDTDQFLAEVIEPSGNYSPYIEIEREASRSLYVDQNPILSTRYKYLVDEISPDVFKSVVFSNPKIVQRSEENEQSEKYTDDISFMTVDKKNRIFNYVYPLAESIAPIPSSKLLVDSFDYVNDHGGFTLDYRFSTMNIGKHMTEYQLFLQGYPIYSKTTTTRILTTWGENRIFRYRRPYYSIESDIPTERAQKKLVSGEQAIEYILTMEDYPFKEVDEVVVGYYLMQDKEDEKVFILEPSWFAISNNESTHISPELAGGITDGLE